MRHSAASSFVLILSLSSMKKQIGIEYLNATCVWQQNIYEKSPNISTNAQVKWRYQLGGNARTN